MAEPGSVEKLAAAVADRAKVDWMELDLSPAERHAVENVRRIERIADSFCRHVDLNPSNSAQGPTGTTGPAGAISEPTPGADEEAAGTSAEVSGTRTIDRWGPFELIEPLGEGGFGTVHAAYDCVLEREVALKLWRGHTESRLERDRQSRRLLDEARKLAQVRHPSVVAIFGADVHDGVAGMWMERLNGASLRELLEVKSLPLSEVLRVGRDLAEALQSVHALRLVHGDVNDGNVFVEPDGRIVLLDFGSAIMAEAVNWKPVSAAPLFLAPEVLLLGQEPSPQSDLYSLGVLIYRAATAEYPVPGQDVAELERRHSELQANETTPSLQWPDGTPDLLRDLVASLLHPNPRLRLQEARDVVRSLSVLEDVGRATSAFEPKLPRRTTRFFGRKREMAQLKERILSGRWVTLVGVGGTGKTRLAIELASQLTSSFPGGMWFVDLTSVETEDQVLPHVYDSMGLLGLSATGIEPILRRVRSQRCLFVLDNAEHLVDPLCDFVERLLDACPETHVLVTSRRALESTSEEVLKLLPLPLPPKRKTQDDSDSGSMAEASREASSETRSGDHRGPGPMPGADTAAFTAPPSSDQNACIRLFLDRTRRRDQDMEDESTVLVAEEICRRLDGIPLAIELAASRAAMLSPEEVLRNLESPLELASTTRPRSRGDSLRASIEWSYGLLRPETQLFFDQLSVFRGGWTLETAEAVTKSAPMEPTAELVASSLVEKRRSESGRVRFELLETLREFSHERLSDRGEEKKRRSQHRDVFLERFRVRSKELFGARQSKTLAGLEEDFANLEQAMAAGLEDGVADPRVRESLVNTANRLHRYWSMAGRQVNGAYFYDRILDAFGETLDPLKSAWVRFHRSRCTRLFRADQTREDARAAFETFTRIGDDQGRGKALVALGGIDGDDLRFEEGDQKIREGIYVLGQTDNVTAYADAYASRAYNFYKWNRLDEAREQLEAALRINREAENSFGLASSLITAGSVSWAQGRYEAAIHELEEALELTRGFPRALFIMSIHSNLGNVYRNLGKRAQAMAHYRIGAQRAEEAGYSVFSCMCLLGLTGYCEEFSERKNILSHSLDVLLEARDYFYALPVFRGIAREGILPNLALEDGMTLLAFEDAFREAQGFQNLGSQAADFAEIVRIAESRLSPEQVEACRLRGRQLDVVAAAALAHKLLRSVETERRRR